MMAVSAGATHSFHKTVATLIDDDGGLTSTFTGGAGGARTRDQRIMRPLLSVFAASSCDGCSTAPLVKALALLVS
jgi:hypothetical protein